MMNYALQISNLEIGYLHRSRKVVKVAGPINVSVEPGELVCLLGPNGVGKSTLIRTMAGIQQAIKGIVSILEKDISGIPKKQLATLLSVVLTDRIGYGNLTAYELISLGRIPHTGWFGSLKPDDEQKINWAVASTDISSLCNKNIHELSDGERQKVMIARALAQDTPVILLDEPTAHLDLPNRIDIIRLLRKLALETGKAIIMSTHELDLALQAADTVWLMTTDNVTYSGSPEDLVLNDVFGKSFTRAGIEFDKKHGVFKVVEPHFKEINISGDEVGVFWTKRALERLGYTVIFDHKNQENIEISASAESLSWICKGKSFSKEFHSIRELIDFIKTTIPNR